MFTKYFLLFNCSFWNQPLNSKKKKTVKQQQRKESNWLLFKKPHILQWGKKKSDQHFFLKNKFTIFVMVSELT